MELLPTVAINEVRRLRHASRPTDIPNYTPPSKSLSGVSNPVPRRVLPPSAYELKSNQAVSVTPPKFALRSWASSPEPDHAALLHARLDQAIRREQSSRLWRVSMYGRDIDESEGNTPEDVRTSYWERIRRTRLEVEIGTPESQLDEDELQARQAYMASLHPSVSPDHPLAWKRVPWQNSSTDDQQLIDLSPDLEVGGERPLSKKEKATLLSTWYSPKKGEPISISSSVRSRQQKRHAGDHHRGERLRVTKPARRALPTQWTATSVASRMSVSANVQTRSMARSLRRTEGLEEYGTKRQLLTPVPSVETSPDHDVMEESEMTDPVRSDTTHGHHWLWRGHSSPPAVRVHSGWVTKAPKKPRKGKRKRLRRDTPVVER